MDLDAILTALGYLRSERNWITPQEADARLAHTYRVAKRAAEKLGEGAEVVGSYVYHTSLDGELMPPRPAVFVARAANDEQAREIHRRFWNLGDCPFVMIVLPNVIRVYTGFDYATDKAARSVVATATMPASGQLPEPLAPFHADAIDEGRIWAEQAKHLGSDRRVDYHLLTNLKELSRLLQQEHNLAREITHALIGKYIYFRYLRDRDILDDDWLAGHGIGANEIFGREATSRGFAALADALQAQFNGDIFPIPSDDDQRWRAGDAIPFLARTFHGDTAAGQLVLDFGAYDFSYIPIELLASVYEHFLKAEGRGNGDGVVYTPEALADYVLAELDFVHPLRLGHKILDPCCGSGVFLVLAYRRLIEKLWQNPANVLQPKT